MKAKTKKRIIHAVTRKKLVKRKTSKHVLRSFLILVATVSMGSLAYGITLNKPTVQVSIQRSGEHGVEIKAPVQLAATPTPQSITGPPAMTGRGSWYALGLPQPDALTCASRTYPRGSFIHVTNTRNKRTVICRVNDYGPEAWTNRIIDLSRGSFRQIENLSAGTVPVELRVASSASGYRLPTDEDIAIVVGYSLCQKRHSASYCDQHRQSY